MMTTARRAPTTRARAETVWLYVPFRSAPGSEESISAWPAGAALFASSSGKPSPRPASWPGWRKRPWIGLLSGMTCERSMLERGVARWISLQGASRASRTALPESSAAAQTSGTSGPSSGASSSSAVLRWRSSRTCPALFDQVDSRPCSETLPRSASMRSGEISERATLERRIDESGSSSWPTAATTDASSSARHTTGTDVMHPATSLTDAIRQWPTPAARDGDNRGADAKRIGQPGRHGGSNLDDWAQLWPTPSATPYGSSQNGRANGHVRPSNGTPSLENQARAMWSTPMKSDADRGSGTYMRGNPTLTGDARTHSRQAQPTAKAGSAGSPRAVLNPCFVEALMGFPPSWTVPIACARSATPSSPPAPSSHSSSSREGC